MASPLYTVNHVSKEFAARAVQFHNKGHVVRALDDVTLTVAYGETTGLVGESGSGKSTLGRLLVRFDTSTHGEILIDDVDLKSLRGRDLLQFRRRVQMIHQNPFSSLNPRRTISDALSSGYDIRQHPRGRERYNALSALLRSVGLHESMLSKYPHEFSGGQRQRIVIARALSANPAVLVADEPVSALDVSIQAQVLNLLSQLKRERGLTMVMITHDLRVANFFCDRIIMLYRGQVVEYGTRPSIMEHAAHPYTRMLLAAAPSGDPSKRATRPWVRGEVGDSTPSMDSCVFSDRCWLREELGNPVICTSERPEIRRLDDAHASACHFAEEVGRRAQGSSQAPSRDVAVAPGCQTPDTKQVSSV